MKKPRFNSIAGVEGSEHVYAVVSAGKKNESGWPIEKDRFHIVDPDEVNGRRTPHEDYAAFNAAPQNERTTIRGNIMHATKDKCFHLQLFNYTNKKLGTHPKERPFCEGDGKRARRWTGKGLDDFVDIDCPNKECPFAISKECKPLMRFYFRIRFAPMDSQNDGINKKFLTMPTTQVKYVSRGWHMVKFWLAFFDDVFETARDNGIGNLSLTGLPFVMRIGKKQERSIKKDEKGKNYPVVRISTETDFITWLNMQRKLLADIRTGNEIIEPVGALSPGENTNAEIAKDWRSVGVIDVPVKYEDPEENKSEPQLAPTETKQAESEKKSAKKYEPMPLDKLAELARLEIIPDEKLPYLIYDTFAHYAERGKMNKPDAYKLLFGSENENGEASVVEWDTAKKDIATLRKFEEKARRAVLNMAKEKK